MSLQAISHLVIFTLRKELLDIQPTRKCNSKQRGKQLEETSARRNAETHDTDQTLKQAWELCQVYGDNGGERL